MQLLFIVNAKNHLNKHSISGFTLLENLVVILLISILATLGISNWLAFVEIRYLNTAQNQVYLAMREAQSQAIKQKLTWQTSFRIQNDIIQWSIHQAETGQFIPDAVKNNGSLWHNLEPNTRIDEEENNKGKKETTLRKHPSQQIWRVLFNHQGCPISEVGNQCTIGGLGQITFYSIKAGKTRRCVYISTILGAVRTGKNNTTANEGDKYCY